MTPDELRAARHQLGLTGVEMANRLRIGKGGDRSIRRWENGESRIPGPVQVAVRLLLERKLLEVLPVDGHRW